LRGRGEHPPGKAGHLVDQAIDGRPLIAAECYLGDRLGGIDANPLGSETKVMTGGNEAGDLASAVGQELVEPQRAARHLVDTVALVAVGK
jgi:hypothetical protein